MTTSSALIRTALGCALAAATALASAQAGPSNPLAQGTPGVPTDRGLFRSGKSQPESGDGVTLHRHDGAASAPRRKPDAARLAPQRNDRARDVRPAAKHRPRGAAASAPTR